MSDQDLRGANRRLDRLESAVRELRAGTGNLPVRHLRPAIAGEAGARRVDSWVEDFRDDADADGLFGLDGAENSDGLVYGTRSGVAVPIVDFVYGLQATAPSHFARTRNPLRIGDDQHVVAVAEHNPDGYQGEQSLALCLRGQAPGIASTALVVWAAWRVGHVFSESGPDTQYPDEFDLVVGVARGLESGQWALPQGTGGTTFEPQPPGTTPVTPNTPLRRGYASSYYFAHFTPGYYSLYWTASRPEWRFVRGLAATTHRLEASAVGDLVTVKFDGETLVDGWQQPSEWPRAGGHVGLMHPGYDGAALDTTSRVAWLKAWSDGTEEPEDPA